MRLGESRVKRVARGEVKCSKYAEVQSVVDVSSVSAAPVLSDNLARAQLVEMIRDEVHRRAEHLN
jgi:hypothetical protein